MQSFTWARNPKGREQDGEWGMLLISSYYKTELLSKVPGTEQALLCDSLTSKYSPIA